MLTNSIVALVALQVIRITPGIIMIVDNRRANYQI